MNTSMEILYEDNHLLIVHKPAGIPVQEDESGDECLLDMGKSYIARAYHKPGNVFLHLAHRIDRPVSGTVILARTGKALERMTTLFREREVRKHYLAVCEGIPQEAKGKLHNKLFKDSSRNKSFVAYKRQESIARDAHLYYKMLGAYGSRSLLLVSPVTGRHHQIRVQLSHIGLPIVGDVKYGGPRHENPRSILLHSYVVSFVHPVRKEPLRVSCLPGQGEGWNPFESILRSGNLDESLDSLQKKN